MQQQLERETVEVTTNSDDMDHYFCEVCYPDPDALCIGLCGVDLTNEPWGHRDDSVKCIVCFDLDEFPCTKCGQ